MDSIPWQIALACFVGTLAAVMAALLFRVIARWYLGIDRLEREVESLRETPEAPEAEWKTSYRLRDRFAAQKPEDDDPPPYDPQRPPVRAGGR